MKRSQLWDQSAPPPRRSTGSVPAKQVKDHLATELFLQTLADTAGRMCEPRPGTVFSANLMVLGLLYMVVEKWPALRTVYSRLVEGAIADLEAVDASEAAFYARLERLPHTLMLALLMGMGPTQKAERTLKRLKELAPFATGFAVFDESTLDALARKSIELRKHARAKEVVLAGRIACLMDMATRQLMQLVYDEDPNANEKSHVAALLDGVAKGTMLVFDLGYFNFGFFDDLTERGIHFVSRQRKKTSFIVQQDLVLGPNYCDRIVLLGKHNSEKAAHPVRLVEIKINGTWWSYITNVLDPRSFPADAVWAIYCCRWSIEAVQTQPIKTCSDLCFTAGFSNSNGTWSGASVAV